MNENPIYQRQLREWRDLLIFASNVSPAVSEKLTKNGYWEDRERLVSRWRDAQSEYVREQVILEMEILNGENLHILKA